MNEWLNQGAPFKLPDPVVSAWNSPLFQGTIQASAGLTEFTAGAITACSGFPVPGALIMTHGADHAFTGLRTLYYGVHRATLTSQMFQRAGMSPQAANSANGVLSMAGTMGGFTMARTKQFTAATSFE